MTTVVSRSAIIPADPSRLKHVVIRRYISRKPPTLRDARLIAKCTDVRNWDTLAARRYGGRSQMAAPAVRRADFLMALAYATDLATGHSRDFALRSCVLAMRLAEVAGLDDDTRRNVYHQALLRYIGCNADTHLLASAFGDEIALRRDLSRIDIGNKSELAETIVRAITRTFAAAPPAELAKAVERGLAEAMQVSVPILSGHCEVARRIAERIGLSDDIRENLGQLYERWDGKGLPRGLSGNAVKLPVRLVTLAQDAIARNEAHGFDVMKTMIAKRAGGAYEPELADLFLAHAERLLVGLDGPVDRETIWRWNRFLIRCSMRRLATKPTWPSPI
jgi:hypothetical protein